MNVALKPAALDAPAEPYADLLAPTTVRIERLLPGPMTRVWSYLTDSAKRAQWLAAGPMELTPGGTVHLTFRNSDLSGGQTNPNGACTPDGNDAVVSGVVTECDPPRLLAFDWSPDGSGSNARFELSEEGGDTRLVVTHQRLASHRQVVNVSAGWHVHIGILADRLAGRTPRSFWPEHSRLEKVYEERFAEWG